MEIIPLILAHEVTIQRAKAVQNRDMRAQIEACLLLGRYYKEHGDFSRAETLYRRARNKARLLRLPDIEADACSGLGLMYQVEGRMDSAVECIDAALAINEERGDQERLAVGYSNKGFVAQLMGNIAESHQLHLRALQLHAAADNRAYWAEECGNLGRLALQQNQLAEAECYFQQGLKVCQELGDMPGISGHYQGLALVYIEQQRLAEAEAILKKGVVLEGKLLRDEGLAHHYSVLGIVYRQMGRFAEAKAMYQQTLAIQQKLGNKQFEARTLRGLAEVLWEEGDAQAAWAVFRQSGAILEEIGDNAGRAVLAAFLGDTDMTLENFAAAEQEYRQALHLFANVSDLAAVAAVKVSLGQAYLANQAPFDALLQWRQALALYRELQQDDRVEYVEELLRTSGLG